ncbi:MAG TPA: hypothetical protein VFH85_01430 [Gammaproteobacteria bacterium]|nr:hypothetical protein [Gammaproteobacteria bacterium]
MNDAAPEYSIHSDEPLSGFACWRRGLNLFARAPVRLLILAALAQYAALGPDIAFALAPEATNGFLSSALIRVAAAVVEAALYAAVVLQIDQIARGGDNPRQLRWLNASIALALAGLLYNIAVAIGLILFVLPGLFLSVTLLLFPFPVVLSGAGPLRALELSYSWIAGRFWRISGAISVAFMAYSGYVVVTWGPGFVGVDWPALASLIATAERGAVSLIEIPAQVKTMVTPGPAAAPLWYFVLNPLLGGIVMPPVLATLYTIYRRLIPPERPADPPDIR